MHNKGQVSLELAVLLLVILTALLALGVITEDIQRSQETLYLQNQAKTIAHHAAIQLSGLAILSQTTETNGIASIQSNAPLYHNPTHTEQCTIKVIRSNTGGDSTITVQIQTPQQQITATDYAYIPDKFTLRTSPFSPVPQIDCGSIFTIDKTP